MVPRGRAPLRLADEAAARDVVRGERRRERGGPVLQVRAGSLQGRRRLPQSGHATRAVPVEAKVLAAGGPRRAGRCVWRRNCPVHHRRRPPPGPRAADDGRLAARCPTFTVSLVFGSGQNTRLRPLRRTRHAVRRTPKEPMAAAASRRRGPRFAAGAAAGCGHRFPVLRAAGVRFGGGRGGRMRSGGRRLRDRHASRDARRRRLCHDPKGTRGPPRTRRRRDRRGRRRPAAVQGLLSAGRPTDAKGTAPRSLPAASRHEARQNKDLHPLRRHRRRPARARRRLVGRLVDFHTVATHPYP
mmetsp:Transcript_3444/g.12092  ORF Transcript_3444/g.12092 Transcript_3444/m.12092 type:complete len:299 (+) Transcript_3444:277-1173(+)